MKVKLYQCVLEWGEIHLDQIPQYQHECINDFSSIYDAQVCYKIQDSSHFSEPPDIHVTDFPSSSEFFVGNKGALGISTFRKKSTDSEEEEDLCQWGSGAKYVTISLFLIPKLALQ